jgi:hypothetical protein
VLKALTVFLLSLIGGNAVSAQSRDINYLCISEFAAGVTYNSNSRKWEGAALRTDSKFALRLKFENSDWKPAREGGKIKHISSYTGTITMIGGAGGKEICEKSETHEPEVITLQPDLFSRTDPDDFGFRCLTSSHEYTFNIKTKRFLSVFLPTEYVEGKDYGDAQPPAISGGTCTRFE